MSIGEDVKFDMMIAEQRVLALITDAFYNKDWLTRDGRLLKISEMDTSHIISTIEFLNRNSSRHLGLDYIRLFKDELIKRGL